MANKKDKGHRSSVPLTPNSIPLSQIPDNKPIVSEDARRIQDPLNFEPQSWFTKIIRIPAIFIFCIVCGYLIGKLGFSFVFLLPIVHISYYYFNRRVNIYKRTIDVLAREKDRIESLGEFESVEWMNHILKKFWDISEQTVSSIIFNEVNNIIMKQVSTSQPFDIRLSEITLGTRPPLVERISFVENAEGKIVLEIAASFIPIEASEEILTYFKKERSHWNTYIEIQITLANLIKVPILVRDFTFSGIFRIELDLTKKIPFINKFRFSFLEMPVIDFKLIPLKSVDMLDLPYVGGVLDSVIKSQIQNMVLTPKYIEVDLEELVKYSGSVVGVVYVYIHDLESIDQSTYWMTLDNSGRRIGVTDKKSGINPVFNQGFYDIISDTTRYLNITLQSTEAQPKRGRINLRNLNRHIFSENLHLSDSNTRRFVNITTQFYPITSTLSDSAIIYLNLISIEDLQCIGDPVNRLYSTYCVVSLESREAITTRSILKRMESKRIFTTKDPFYNEFFKFFVRGFEDYIIKIKVHNEKDGKAIGTVIVPCIDIKNGEPLKYRISGVENGEMNLKFEIKYVDMTNIVENEDESVPNNNIKVDSKKILRDIIVDKDSQSKNMARDVSSDSDDINELHRSKKETILGSYLDISPGETVSEDIKSLSLDIPSLSLGIYNKNPIDQSFATYKKAFKFAIKSFSAYGVFYLVFETARLNLKMDPFTTDIDVKHDLVVPVETENEIRMRLFRMASDGDILISEERYQLNEEQTVVVFDKIRIEFTVESCELTDFNDTEQDDRLKILQVKIDDFCRAGIFTMNYFTDSFVQNVKLTHRMSTFVLGDEPLCCKIYDNHKEITQFKVPVRNCSEEFDFGKGLKANIRCKAQVCEFKKIAPPKSGEIEVFLIKADKISPIKGSTCDPYIKVFLNGEKIHKTDVKYKNRDPVFNESFRINVERNVDIIGFHIYSSNSLSIDTLVHFKNISLFNIPEGYSRYTVKMNDENTGEYGETTLQVIFNYKKKNASQKIKGIINLK